jgi:hypothetical protein
MGGSQTPPVGHERRRTSRRDVHKLSLRLCFHWANHAPREVPLAADGEWWFIAIDTPEFTDECDAPATTATALTARRAEVNPRVSR